MSIMQKFLFSAIIISLFSLSSETAFSQPLAKTGYTNPVIYSLRDGCVEKFMGNYYAMGGGTKGKIRASKDMVNWTEGVQSVTTTAATWLNDPQWTEAYVYTEVAAGDILYRNGVFHTYWNGIGHAYSATPLGPYKESSVSAPFDNYGIDMQVFQDQDGEIYWVKKRNKQDPHPMTGATSTLSGPEIWTFKMISPFSRWDITTAGVQLTHQPGHPTSVSHHNFEGPEMFKNRGRYFIFYTPNRMGVRSGMYEVCAAESDQPMNFNNAKKYPHPVLTRNTEQHLIDYKVILNSAEHGGWTSKYTTTTPAANWITAAFNDNTWTTALGGYGKQEYDLLSGGAFTNAKIRARKTVWNTPNIYIRRKFMLSETPQKVALKHWVYGDANFYINGNKINIKTNNDTYSTMQIDPSMLVVGENIIAVEVASPCSDTFCQQLIDFGLYDTGKNDGEDIAIAHAQPNFVTGPNGFERWIMYKAYFNASQQQGIDRIHFYDKEVVVESSTLKNTQGYRPKPAQPSFITFCDYAIMYPYQFLGSAAWKIYGGILQPSTAAGGELVFRKEPETNYRFEVPFRIKEANGRAGVYAFYQDEQNWLKVTIGKDRTWKTETNTNGSITTSTQNLPDKFAFLENNSLVSAFEEPWHTMVVYKNGNRFRVELDYFNLTLNGDLTTTFNGKGTVGLTASSDQVSFDAIQYTMGYDEYDQQITGWENAIGTWNITSEGLKQANTTGKAAIFKGDAAWNYEFSAYMKNNKIPVSGKAGYYPLYIDEQNYVCATINYGTKTLDIEGKENGTPIQPQSLSLKKKNLRYYTFDTYPTSSYRYDFRNESEISGVDILWFEGNYPYLNQTFELPKTVQFYGLQNGSWTLLNAQLEGQLRFSDMNHFSFQAIKTTAIRMDVTNNAGLASRAFSAYFDEEAAAGYFLRCRREEDGLHLFVDNTYLAKIEGGWDKSRVGLYTENQSANYNGILYYQSGGISLKSIAIAPANCAVGESVKLSATVLPNNATNKTLLWESSNPAIASVTQDGVLTKHATGYAKITAYTTDGGVAKGSIEISATDIAKTYQEKFFVFPNPADNFLYYKLDDAKKLTIFSLKGEMLAQHTPNGCNKVAIDKLNPGMYIFSATNSDSVYNAHFIVNR